MAYCSKAPTRVFRRLLGAVDGSVAVEFALIFSLILVPVVTGVADEVVVYQGQARVDEAVQDAMTYVMNTGSSATAAGITTAADASNSASIAVSTSTACYCVSTITTTPTTPTLLSCGGTCPTNMVYEQFMNIQITSAITLPLPVNWIGLTDPFIVSATGLVRTR